MKPTTTITLSSFGQLTPETAMKQLASARTGTIILHKDNRKIEKLLEIAPIIFLENGMKARIPGTLPDFDSVCLPHSKAGNRVTSDELTMTFMLEQGITMKAKLSRESTATFLPSRNLATLAPATKTDVGEKEKLVEEYERALNNCDCMLIFLYCGLMQAKGLNEYTKFIALLETEFKLGKGAMKHMLTSIPGTFLSTGENDLLYDTNHGLVGRRARVPWLEKVKDVGSFCVLIPLDHNVLDIDTSSFHILASEAKSFKNPDTLMLYIISVNVPAVIQLYRLGRFVMDAPRTKAVIKFLLNADAMKVWRLNHRELVLMGGVLAQKDVTDHIELIVTEMLEEGINSPRYGVLFCYLSSLSVAPHCMIDIVKRLAEYNVTRYLLSSVKVKGEKNVSLKPRLADIAFYLMHWLMQIDATRLHSETFQTFADYKYLITIDVAKPTKNPNLDIFKQRHKLGLRFYIDFIKNGSTQDVTIYNEMNSIVLLPEEEVQSDTARYDSSTYLIYDREGKVIIDTRERNSSMAEDDFSPLEADSLTELLAVRDGSPAIQQIQHIFSEGRQEILTIPFRPTEGYHHLYTANLEGIALERFTKKAREARAPQTKNFPKLAIEKKEDLFCTQLINLLQETPIRVPVKGSDDDLHFFITQRQLRTLGRATVGIQQLRRERDPLQRQLEALRETSKTASHPDLEEEIAHIDADIMHWTNMVFRIPTSSELYGKAAIDKTLRDATALRAAYNSAEKPRNQQSQAAKPKGKGAKTSQLAGTKLQEHLAAQTQGAVAGETEEERTLREDRERKREKDRKRLARISAQKQDKFKATQTEKKEDERMKQGEGWKRITDPKKAKAAKAQAEEEDDSDEEEEKSIEDQLLHTQQRLTDLIRFSTDFETALARFISTDIRGPLSGEYLSRAERTINEKLGQLHSRKESSMESILAAYRARDTKNPVIKYRPDFSRYERMVPDKNYIKRHHPSYFTIGATQIASMVIRESEEGQPRFEELNLTNDEVVVMARLEKTEQRQGEFKDLIAVLYHMLRATTLTRSELETHTTIFKRMISEASNRGKV